MAKDVVKIKERRETEWQLWRIRGRSCSQETLLKMNGKWLRKVVKRVLVAITLARGDHKETSCIQDWRRMVLSVNKMIIRYNCVILFTTIFKVPFPP